MFSFLKYLTREARVVRRIGAAFRRADAASLHALVRNHKRVVATNALRWKQVGRLEGHQSLGVTRAFERIFSDESLTLLLISDEPEIMRFTGFVNQLYDRLNASPNEVFTAAEEMLIQIAQPRTHGQYLLVIDCLGLALRALFVQGKYSEAERMNTQGISISRKCLDVFSEKMFLQNKLIIDGRKPISDNDSHAPTAIRLASIEHLIHETP